MIQEYIKRVNDSAACIRSLYAGPIESGIILGTGLGHLVTQIDEILRIPYNEIPGMPVPTVESHQGNLVIGQLGGVPVMVFQGRFHLYEGYQMNDIVLPVRILHTLGVKKLIISNAAGGLNPDYKRGDVMILRDHINLLPDNPLKGQNNALWGPRFPDLLDPYDLSWIRIGKEFGLENDINVHDGIYAAVMGPNLETRAEYRYMRIIGADAIGMSTVPEVLVARHSGMRVFATSIITDLCYEPALGHVTLEEILEAAENAQPLMTQLFIKILQS